MHPATIKIFLTKGNPKSLRTAEISNWTGKAIACPRSELKDLLNRDEILKPGIYILNGLDPETGESSLYIGEAESVGKRLKGHSDKDFWVNVITFISKDENLTKAHAKYLEGKLIENSSCLKNVKIINSISSGAKLPESDQAEMDFFLEKIYQLLPILGNDLFSKPRGNLQNDKDILTCKIKALVAKGMRTPNGFLVFKDSQAVLQNRPSAKWTKKRREELIKSGILIKQKDFYIFSTDYEFGSPSTAGSIVRGGATNGLTIWKNNNGKSLKQIELE